MTSTYAQICRHSTVKFFGRLGMDVCYLLSLSLDFDSISSLFPVDQNDSCTTRSVVEWYCGLYCCHSTTFLFRVESSTLSTYLFSQTIDPHLRSVAKHGGLLYLRSKYGPQQPTNIGPWQPTLVHHWYVLLCSFSARFSFTLFVLIHFVIYQFGFVI